MEGGSRLLYAHVVYDDKNLHKMYEDLFGKLPPLMDEKRFPLKGCPRADNPKSEENRAWDSMAPGDQASVNRVYANLGKSLEAFERKIVSRDSRLDTYVAALKGNQKEKFSILTDNEKRGLKLFAGKAKCATCHSGPNFTDGGFHNLRVPPRDKTLPEDLGRYAGIPAVKANPFNGGGAFSDDPSGKQKNLLEHLEARPIHKGQFKTPGLRNVASFGPYMHQGQVKTLREVVEYYSTLKGALPLKGPDEGLLTPLHLKPSEIDDLVSFLHTLTDESATAKLALP
jgi:cytochrome c peroxidase